MEKFGKEYNMFQGIEENVGKIRDLEELFVQESLEIESN